MHARQSVLGTNRHVPAMHRRHSAVLMLHQPLEWLERYCTPNCPLGYVRTPHCFSTLDAQPKHFSSSDSSWPASDQGIEKSVPDPKPSLGLL